MDSNDTDTLLEGHITGLKGLDINYSGDIASDASDIEFDVSSSSPRQNYGESTSQHWREVHLQAEVTVSRSESLRHDMTEFQTIANEESHASAAESTMTASSAGNRSASISATSSATTSVYEETTPEPDSAVTGAAAAAATGSSVILVSEERSEASRWVSGIWYRLYNSL